MAVGNRVKVLNDIASYDPKTLKLKQNAVPRGTFGIVTQEDLTQQVVIVKFENGVTAVFGTPDSSLPDTTDSLEVVSNPTGSLL